MLFLVIAVSAAVLSLLVSFAAGHLSAPVPIVGNFLRLTLSQNAGIAFGISLPSPWQEILILCALIVICVVAVQSTNDRISSIAFGLIIGGAGTNLIDRAMHGSVTDFIAIGTFPVFNLADVFITIGAGLLIIDTLHRRQLVAGS